MTAKKELFIVRHAKSSWDIESISDVDRPLKLRGIRNAYEMARRLKIERRTPQLFVSSPANRAMHTAIIFLNVFELTFEKLKIDGRLYGHGIHAVLEAIAEQDSSVNKMMIFGHNPDFSELARTFAKEPIMELPTTGMAIFTFNCQKWSEINRNSVTEQLIDYPKREI